MERKDLFLYFTLFFISSCLFSFFVSSFVSSSTSSCLSKSSVTESKFLWITTLEAVLIVSVIPLALNPKSLKSLNSTNTNL